MDLDKLKQEYNHNLTRYYNGCKYLEEHRDEAKKWLPEILRIQDRLGVLIENIMKYQKVDHKEILEGFERSDEK